MFLYQLAEKTRNARSVKAKMIKAIGINEKDAILARVDEVPAWVFFPDKERVEWLNKFLKQIWPNVTVYSKKIMLEVIEPIMNQYGNLHFEEIDLGDIVIINIISLKKFI